jgi:hypothetical protein
VYADWSFVLLSECCITAFSGNSARQARNHYRISVLQVLRASQSTVIIQRASRLSDSAVLSFTNFFNKGQKKLKFSTNLRDFSKIAAIALICIPVTVLAGPVTGQISLSGYGAAVGSVSFGTATGIDFANASGTTVSGTSGTLSSFGAGTGTFAALGGCASTTTGCGTIKDIASFTSSAPISAFLTLTTGGPSVSFDLASITAVTETGSGSNGSLTFTGIGTINFSGFDATPGEFILTAQGNQISSFSATTLATLPQAPEPSTWATMSLGILGLGFLAIRRNSKSSSIAA